MIMMFIIRLLQFKKAMTQFMFVAGIYFEGFERKI